MEYPEMHTPESYTELEFFTELRKLMENCGYSDFSWRDLYAPESKRLRMQLSAIVNFCKFRQDQLDVYRELNEPRSELFSILEALNEENMELTETFEMVKEESKHKSHELQQVIDECQELENEIARNNHLQTQAREEAAALKTQAKDLKDELATAVWALEEAEAEEERLRGQVISSPDRRKAEMVHRRERLDKMKLECEQLETDLQVIKTKIFHAKQISKDVEQATSSLDDLQEQAGQYSQLVRQVEDASATIEATEKKTATYQQENEQAERELHRAEEKILHERQQQKLQMDAMQEALEVAKSQLLNVEKDRREGMARVDAGEAELRDIEAAMEQERRKTDQEIDDMIAEYKETEELFLNRNAKIMSVIQATS